VPVLAPLSDVYTSLSIDLSLYESDLIHESG